MVLYWVKKQSLALLTNVLSACVVICNVLELTVITATGGMAR